MSDDKDKNLFVSHPTKKFSIPTHVCNINIIFRWNIIQLRNGKKVGNRGKNNGKHHESNVSFGGINGKILNVSRKI